MQTQDIIVIGAGPAGATAACLLARSGAQVMLIDRDAFPRKKLCGGCIAQTGFELLRSHQLGNLPSLQHAPIIERLDLRSDTRQLNLRVDPYRVIDRSAFDHDLVRAAVDAGSTFLSGTRARVCPDHRVELKDARQTTQMLSARVTIVADGLQGAALREIEGFEWRVEGGARVGIGAILDELPAGCASDAITMLHGPCGYAGLAPLCNGRALVAAAVDPDWVRMQHHGPPLIALLRALGLNIDPDTSLNITGGAPGLTRTRDAIEADGRLFLIGDATGYIEPFTGEGMTWALQDACMIAKHARAVLDGRYTRSDWTAQHRRVNRRRKALCHVSTRLLRTPQLTRALMSVSSCSPAMGWALTGAVRALQQRTLPETSLS